MLLLGDAVFEHAGQLNGAEVCEVPVFGPVYGCIVGHIFGGSYLHLDLELDRPLLHALHKLLVVMVGAQICEGFVAQVVFAGFGDDAVAAVAAFTLRVGELNAVTAK